MGIGSIVKTVVKAVIGSGDAKEGKEKSDSGSSKASDAALKYGVDYLESNSSKDKADDKKDKKDKADDKKDKGDKKTKKH